MRRLLSATLALGILVTGCSKVDQTSETAGRVNSFTVPHVLRFADATDVSTLNPHLGQLLTILRLSQMTMAWLIKWDANNQPYPELATEVPSKANGGISPDGLTITYHIRKGVKWSDGAPFDADDVVFSTNVVLNKANNEVNREGWDRIAKIDEPNKYTVVYHLTKPFSPFIEVFFSTAGANPCILPKHLLGNLPNINNAPYNALPVGIGPFKYQEWDRQQQIVLVANPNYFRGLPKLQKVIFKIVPDRNTLLAQFQAKQLDLWPFLSGNYLDRARALTPYTVLTGPGFAWNHVDVNLANPALADPVVRHALLYGLDRQTILTKIWHNLGTLTDSPTPTTAAYYVAIPATPYDPAKANDMLDKDGWKMGSDGVRVKNGQRLSFRYATYTGSPDNDSQIELIRANWQKLGVDLNVRHYAIAQYFAPLPDGLIYDRKKFDITGLAWVNEAVGDYSQIYGCDQVPPHGQNFTGWVNPKACAAMTNLYTHYDQADRNKDVAIIVKTLADDAVAPVVDLRENAYLMNKDLKGFQPNGVSDFDNFMDVDI